MIISASRRTDIPAFYSEWFINRIKDGFFYNVNPFNRKQIKEYSLSPEDVDVIVFWSKYPKPLFKYLDFLNSIGFNYYFQFTLNHYPKIYEPFVPSIDERIEAFKELSERVGGQKVIWRYDPIIISSVTDKDYHLEKIYDISIKLKGCTDKLIISFLDFYGKVKKRLLKLTQGENIKISDIIDISFRDDLFELAKGIYRISNEFGFDVFTCAENIDLYEVGIKHGSCIDVGLIRKLFGIKTDFNKDKNQRKECLCGESVDMGVYDTCKYQCNYCYANRNIKTIQNNILKHNTNNPTLIGLDLTDVKVQPFIENSRQKKKQLSLL